MKKFLKRALLPLMLAAAVIMPSSALADPNDYVKCTVTGNSGWVQCTNWVFGGTLPPDVNMRGTHSWSNFRFFVYLYDANLNYLGTAGPWTRQGTNYGGDWHPQSHGFPTAEEVIYEVQNLSANTDTMWAINPFA